MMNPPLLSIIMPVYNVECYIEQCLLSIINQSFTNFELIIIDDGSMDNSRKICERYAQLDSRISIYTQHNQGLSAARNYGLSKAQGSYIGFVDSDDYLNVHMYEKMMNIAIQKDVDIVICGKIIDKKGKLEEKPDIKEEERTLNNIEATKEILLDTHIHSFAWDKIYKASLWENIEFPIGRYFEDTATTYKVIERASKVVQISDCLYYYRYNENSICNHPDIQKVLKRAYDNFEAFHSRYLYTYTNDLYADIRSSCIVKAFTFGTDALIYDMFLNHSQHQKDLKKLFVQLRGRDFPKKLQLSYYCIRYFFPIYRLHLWFKWKNKFLTETLK